MIFRGRNLPVERRRHRGRWYDARDGAVGRRRHRQAERRRLNRRLHAWLHARRPGGADGRQHRNGHERLSVAPLGWRRQRALHDVRHARRDAGRLGLSAFRRRGDGRCGSRRPGSLALCRRRRPRRRGSRWRDDDRGRRLVGRRCVRDLRGTRRGRRFRRAPRRCGQRSRRLGACCGARLGRTLLLGRLVDGAGKLHRPRRARSRRGRAGRRAGGAATRGRRGSGTRRRSHGRRRWRGLVGDEKHVTRQIYERKPDLLQQDGGSQQMQQQRADQ